MSNQNQPEEKRAYPRIDAIALIEIAQQTYPVKNWSAHGLCLGEFKQTMNQGDSLPSKFELNFQEGMNFALNITVEVIWQSASEETLGVKFLNLAAAEQNLLSQLIERIQQEEITPIKPTQPVVPSDSLAPTSTQTELAPPSKQPRNYQKIAVYSLYIVVGTLLGGVAISSLKYSAQHMQIETATITDTVESIVSTNDGRIGEVLIEPGMRIEKDRPLLQINNQDAIDREVSHLNTTIRTKQDKISDLQQEIELKKLELARIPLIQRTTESLKQQEIDRLQSYKEISQSNLNSARNEVQSLSFRKQLAKEELKRSQELVEQGIISQQELESKTADLIALNADLVHSREALQVANTAWEAVQQGSFYDGNKLVGKLLDLNVETVELQDQMLVAQNQIFTLEQSLIEEQQKLEESKKQKNALENPELNNLDNINLPNTTYRAPFSGTVLQVSKSPGNTVNQGDTLVLLRPEGEELTVDAYLSHDRASLVTIGKKAEIKIGTSGEHYLGKVIEIDHTGGFQDSIRGKHSLEGSDDRPAHVQLIIDNVTPEARKKMPGGMPVTVKFVKPPLFPRLANVVRKTVDNFTQNWQFWNGIENANRYSK